MKVSRERGELQQHSAAVSAPAYRTTDQLIAIGSSTGGLDAIQDVLIGVPVDAPGL